MATVLDVSLLQYFSPILMFLIVFVAVYALLIKIKFFTEKPGMNAIISFALALMFVFSSAARKTLEFALPWFLILGGLLIVILILLGLFGIVPEPEKMIADRRVMNIIIILSIVIIIFSLANSLGQDFLEDGSDVNNETVVSSASDNLATDSNSFSDNVYKTIFHPKVLGLIMIMLISLFSILFIAGPAKR